MPLIAQICMLVVTTAVVGMAVIALRLMLRTKTLIENANQSLAELPALIQDARSTSARADELLLAFTKITRSVNAGVAQFEGLATRTGSLASQALDEIERPASAAIGVMRGVRVAASHLFRLWQDQSGRPSPSNQGEAHVGEQRWLDARRLAARSRRRSGTGPDVRANGR